jgi:hypothetical protein
LSSHGHNTWSARTCLLLSCWEGAGIFQFEVNNEELIGKAPKIREQLHFEVSAALRAALSHYEPSSERVYTAEEAAAQGLPGELAEWTTPLAAHKHVVNNVVALALAGNGPELLRIIHLSGYLAPFSIALSSEDAATGSPGATPFKKRMALCTRMCSTKGGNIQLMQIMHVTLDAAW